RAAAAMPASATGSPRARTACGPNRCPRHGGTGRRVAARPATARGRSGSCRMFVRAGARSVRCPFVHPGLGEDVLVPPQEAPQVGGLLALRDELEEQAPSLQERVVVG